MRLRNRLDAIMRATGTSTRDLAKAIGVDKNTIANIRLDRSTLRDEVYARICKHFGVEISDLLYIEDERDSHCEAPSPRAICEKRFPTLKREERREAEQQTEGNERET
jgi:DNA-binding Xre family transcriptional regulator